MVGTPSAECQWMPDATHITKSSVEENGNEYIIAAYALIDSPLFCRFNEMPMSLFHAIRAHVPWLYNNVLNRYVQAHITGMSAANS